MLFRAFNCAIILTIKSRRSRHVRGSIMSKKVPPTNINISSQSSQQRIINSTLIDECEKRISSLKFLDIISSNNESILYRVNQLPDNKTIYVCKKIIFDRLPAEQQARNADIEQNLRAVQRLIHPHIIKCHRVFILNVPNGGGGEYSAAIYSVLDYYKDGSIQDRLKKSGMPLPLKQSRIWIGQILGAVNYIHARGMAHRNIKLTNLLIASPESVILSGFGRCCLAFKREVDIMRTTLFEPSAMYRAPEMHSICSRIWPYDAKAADMYAIGVCLFQMVNLAPPFDLAQLGTDYVSYIGKQRNRCYAYASRFAAHNSAKMKHLISLLLEPKPGIRITANSALLHEALLPSD